MGSLKNSYWSNCACYEFTFRADFGFLQILYFSSWFIHFLSVNDSLEECGSFLSDHTCTAYLDCLLNLQYLYLYLIFLVISMFKLLFFSVFIYVILSFCEFAPFLVVELHFWYCVSFLVSNFCISVVMWHMSKEYIRFSCVYSLQAFKACLLSI